MGIGIEKRIEKTSVIWGLGIWMLGSWGYGGGLLKKVKNKSLMTFPDAQYLSCFNDIYN